MRQQDGDKQAKLNNDSSILTNESLNGSNLFNVPHQSLNSSVTPTSSTNISSYLQQQSLAGGSVENSINKPEPSSTPITTQINKILKKPKKDNEKIMLLSDDEF
jgi:hypothetical protein